MSKRKLFFLFFLGCFYLQGQAYTLDSIAIKTHLVVPDGMGNIFVVTDDNILMKLDSGLATTATQSLINYGRATSIECNGGTEVIVYCYNTGVLAVFDNFLKEKNKYELAQLVNPKPNLICMSKTGWWSYDEYAMKITSLKSNFQKSFTLPDIIQAQTEIVKISENKFSRPVVLCADNALLVPYEDPQAPSPQESNNTVRITFKTTPCMSYNVPEVITLSNDTLCILPLDNPWTAPFKKQMGLISDPTLSKVTMVMKSNTSLFFVKPTAIQVIHDF